MRARKIVELPRPAGVIFALIPVTNPIATVYFKTLLALMTRNAIILSPHPGAKACCADAARTLAEAAKAAGAPDGVIQVLAEPNIPLIEKLMSDERVDLIVATGGPSVVKAAYRSGNPAFGVGPGNAPVLVDDSADLKLAAKRIVESKAFDNSILCTNESTVLAFSSIADRLLEAMKAERAHICSKEETREAPRAALHGYRLQHRPDRQGREHHCPGSGLQRAECENSGDAGRSRAAGRKAGARKALPGAGFRPGAEYRPGALPPPAP